MEAFEFATSAWSGMKLDVKAIAKWVTPDVAGHVFVIFFFTSVDRFIMKHLGAVINRDL